MESAVYPSNELQRQASLERLHLLGTPPEESFDRVARIAARLLSMPIAAFSVISERRLFFKASVGLDADCRRLIDSIPCADTFCAHPIFNDEPLVITNALADERYAGHPLVTGEPQIRFYAGVPVHGPDGLPVGALCVIDQQPRQFTDAELLTLTELAAILERELLLRSLVRTDAITGLYNRRHFDLEIKREWRRAVRQGSSVTAMLIDIDCFRDYNNTYGREQGDVLLRKVADILSKRFQRSSDMLIRGGGGEFLVILLDTTMEAAAILAEDLRHKVQALDIPHADSSHQRVTISIGGIVDSTTAESATGPLMMVRETNVALYAAKGGGRNKVVLQQAKSNKRSLPNNRSNLDLLAIAEAKPI